MNVMMMPTATRQVNVVAGCLVLVAAEFFHPVRMMPTTAQQQVQAEGQERDECDEITHREWATSHTRLFVRKGGKSIATYCSPVSSTARN